MFKGWAKAATPVRCLLGNVLGFSVYADESVPEDELWIMSGLDEEEPIAKITNIKYKDDDQYLTYEAKFKKPLKHVSLTLTPEKEGK